MGGEAIGVQANVSSEADTAKFIKATLDAFGKINVAVASAGIIRDGTMLTLDKETGKVISKSDKPKEFETNSSKNTLLAFLSAIPL